MWHQMELLTAEGAAKAGMSLEELWKQLEPESADGIMFTKEDFHLMLREEQTQNVVVVDCGSGYSRFANFALLPSGVLQTKRSITHISGLDKVLGENTEVQQKWIQQLKEIVNGLKPYIKKPSVMVGATAGVRESLNAGKINMQDIIEFSNLLDSLDLPFQTTVRVLSGVDEAKYEYASAIYCMKQCGYAASGMKIGLLSSGGMSSQVCLDDLTVSIDTEVKRGNSMGLEMGMEKAVMEFQARVTSAVDAKLTNSGLRDEEHVMYLAIEMFAGVGEKAGMKGLRGLTAKTALKKLRLFVEKAIQDDKDANEEDERTWRTYVHVMTGLMASAVLEHLHPNAEVLFLREFEAEQVESGGVMQSVGKELQDSLKPSWSLGYAIEALIHR